MDRAEVVAALREAYQSGGMRLLAAIADDIREHGPLHDPEWAICEDCGGEFDADPIAAELNGTKKAARCRPCTLIHRNNGRHPT